MKYNAPDGKVNTPSAALYVAPNGLKKFLARGIISRLNSGIVLRRNNPLKLSCSCHPKTIGYINNTSDLPEPTLPPYRASFIVSGMLKKRSCFTVGRHENCPRQFVVPALLLWIERDPYEA